MPNDLTIEFRDERNGQRMGRAQFSDDELLGAVGVGCVLEGSDSGQHDGLSIAGLFCSNVDGYGHREAAIRLPSGAARSPEVPCPC